MKSGNADDSSEFSPAEKSAIREVLGGACSRDAAVLAGLPLDRVEAVYARFQESLEEAMIQSARRFVADALESAPAILPTPIGFFPSGSMEAWIKDLLRKHGIRRGEEIDDRGSACSLAVDESDATESPMKSTGLGIGRALKKYPVINGNPDLRNALYVMAGDLMELVADMEPADRAEVIDRKFAKFAESQQANAKQGMLQLPPRQ